MEYKKIGPRKNDWLQKIKMLWALEKYFLGTRKKERAPNKFFLDKRKFIFGPQKNAVWAAEKGRKTLLGFSWTSEITPLRLV